MKAEKLEISTFKVSGDFNLIYKKQKTYIECIINCYIENNIFGTFLLEKSKFYAFNLITVGRDPKLKRNNLFISKRRIYQLIKNGQIAEPIDIINKIAFQI